MVRHKIHTHEQYTVNYVDGLELRIAAITTNGMKREDNEDNFALVVPTYRNGKETSEALIVVADGMGGHEHGEEASRIVVETYREQFMEESFNLLSAATAADERIITTQDGAGSTVVALHLKGKHSTFQNIGDARLYRYNGHLEQLTKDQSVVQQSVDAGRITREEMSTHPVANVVTNSIGIGFNSEMSEPYEPLDMLSMDRYLLCSDGLWDMLTDNEIGDIFRQEKEADETATMLVNAANKKGGNDNITVAIVDVVPRGYIRRNPFEGLRGVRPAEYPVVHERHAEEDETIQPLPIQKDVVQKRQTLFDTIAHNCKRLKDNAYSIGVEAGEHIHKRIIEAGDEFFGEFDYIYTTAERIAKSPQLNNIIDSINRELTVTNTAIEGFGRYLLLNSREIFKRRTAFLGRMSSWIDDLITELGRESDAVPVTVEGNPETYDEYYSIATNTYFANRIRERATDIFGATREIPAGSDEKALKALRAYVETTGLKKVFARWGLNRHFIGLPQGVINVLHKASQNCSLSEIITELYTRPEHQRAAVLVFRQEMGYTRLSKETTAEVLNLLRDARETSLPPECAFEQIHFLAFAAPGFLKQNDIESVKRTSAQIRLKNQKNILGHIDAVVAYHYGTQALADGKLDIAEDNFHAVLRRDNRYLRFVGIDMEDVYVGLGRVEKVIEKRELAQAEELFHIQNYYAAWDKYTQLVSRNPNCIAAHIGIARTWIATGDHESAIARYKIALELQPNNIELLYAIAESYSSSRNDDNAAKYYAHVVQIHPSYEDAQEKLDAYLIHQFNIASELIWENTTRTQGISLLERIVDLDRTVGDIYKLLGDGYLWNNDSTSARTAYKIAANSPRFWNEKRKTKAQIALENL